MKVDIAVEDVDGIVRHTHPESLGDRGNRFKRGSSEVDACESVASMHEVFAAQRTAQTATNPAPNESTIQTAFSDDFRNERTQPSVDDMGFDADCERHLPQVQSEIIGGRWLQARYDEDAGRD
jgi:hypothetical protein